MEAYGNMFFLCYFKFLIRFDEGEIVNFVYLL